MLQSILTLVYFFLDTFLSSFSPHSFFFSCFQCLSSSQFSNSSLLPHSNSSSQSSESHSSFPSYFPLPSKFSSAVSPSFILIFVSFLPYFTQYVSPSPPLSMFSLYFYCIRNKLCSLLRLQFNFCKICQYRLPSSIWTRHCFIPSSRIPSSSATRMVTRGGWVGVTWSAHVQNRNA